MKHFKGKLQRSFEVLVDGHNYRTVHSLDELITWAENVISRYANLIDKHDDAFISNCEELKNSDLKFSDILKELNQIKRETNTQADEIFADNIAIGMRNDHFVRLEAPIFVMQYNRQHCRKNINKRTPHPGKRYETFAQVRPEKSQKQRRQDQFDILRPNPKC